MVERIGTEAERGKEKYPGTASVCTTGKTKVKGTGRRKRATGDRTENSGRRTGAFENGV